MTMAKKIFLTGSNGFIGRNIKESLGQFYNIISPNSRDLDLLNEAAVHKFLRKNKFDVVIHCATHNATVVSDKNLSKVLQSNRRMFFNIARCDKFFGKMFYFGSGAEFDKRCPIIKVKEIDFDKKIPIDDYGFSKYIMTKYIKSTSNIYNLRLFGCFGKHEDWRIRFISNAICRVIFDMDVTISRNVYFDYLYIEDLVKIVKCFIEMKKIRYKEYNICSGKKIDLITLAGKILKVANKKTIIKVLRKGLKAEYTGDNTRLKAEIKNLDLLEIDDSIKKLYDWYSQNKFIIDKEQIR